MNIQTISPYTCYTCVAKRAKDIWIRKDVCLLNVVDFLILVGPFECRCLREKKIIIQFAGLAQNLPFSLLFKPMCVHLVSLPFLIAPFRPRSRPRPPQSSKWTQFSISTSILAKKMKRKPSHQMNCYDGHGHTVKRASERWNEWVQALLIATRKQTAKNAKQIRKNLLLWMREKEIPKFKILQRDVFICFILCGIN